MNPDLLLATRGGIGDHIISAGIVNFICNTKHGDRRINLVCYDEWYEPLKYLYEDNPLITLLPGKQDRYLGPAHEDKLKRLAKTLNLKYYSICTTNVDIARYQQSFYKSTGYPFSFRYSKFPLPKRTLINDKLINKFKPNKPYALCHFWDKLGHRTIGNIRRDVITSGLDIIEIVPGLTNNLFEWLPIIYEAEEFHCIPGGPFHLIDTLKVLGKCRASRYVYHRARLNTMFNPNHKHNNKCWQIVNYKKKEAL